MEDIPKATPEQIKEVSKILSKARFTLLGTSLKAMLALFTANFVTLTVGRLFLGDVDPEMIAGFNFISIMLNAIFCFRYLDGQLKANDAKLKIEIKEVLKKKEE